MVHPHLDADGAHGGVSGAEAVIDLGAEGMQRHAAFAVPLAAAHLGTTETAGALDADALGTALASGLHGLAHRTAEGHAAFELLSNGLSDKVRIELGTL